jgi:hypothetical protein
MQGVAMNVIAAIAASAGGSSKTERFCQRMDEYLATLAPEQRRAWLQRQLGVWVRQYERWAYDVDSGKPTPDGVDCNDYLDTISAIDRRLHELAS